MTKARFTEKFKDEAVSLALQLDTSIAEVARSLGINSGNLHRRIKEYQIPEVKALPAYPRIQLPSATHLYASFW